MKPTLVHSWEETVITAEGYEISLRMRLWMFTSGQYSAEFPEGYKFSWIAFNIEKSEQEFVLFDNHSKKPPHYHIDDKKKYVFFDWGSREKAEKLFFQKVQERFGYFELNSLE